MKRLLVILLLLFCSTAQAYEPDWWIKQVPSGDFAKNGIAYTQPDVTTGKAWFLTDGKIIPCGENGGYPGGHEAYVSTYNPDLFPSDDTKAVHAPAPNIKVAYWCSGEDKPSPTNSHWVLLPTWPNGITDPTAYGVDFPIYQQNTCKIAVYNGDGYPSAIISNIHTRHADDTTCSERDRNQGHWSYSFMFTLVDLDALVTATPTTKPTNTSTPTQVPSSTPTQTPLPEPTKRPTPTPAPTWTPVITTPTIEQIRNAAWLKAGVNYNPDAAFTKAAREQGLGIPLSNEFDLGDTRIQAFSQGIIYCKIGDWSNIRGMAW